MKMSFSVQTPSMTLLNKTATDGMKDVLFEAMIKMEQLAKEKVPVDRGTLKVRIHLDPIQRGAKQYILSDGVEYGMDLEFGNRPHYVEWESIEDWVRRKGIRTTEGGIGAFTKYVVEKIKKEGVNAQPFFRPSLHEVQYTWLPIIQKKIFGNDAQT